MVKHNVLQNDKFIIFVTISGHQIKGNDSLTARLLYTCNDGNVGITHCGTLCLGNAT